MFEATQEDAQQRSKAGLLIGVLVVIALVGFGVFAYMSSKGGSKAASSTEAASAAPAASVAGADPVKDLRVLSATMQKDYTGTANWSVDIRNESHSFTYSNIGYQTSYMGANNNVIGSNKGTIPKLSLGPGEEQSVQFGDAQFPDGTSWYKVVVTGANASTQ
jgi:hypothetical protein